MHSARRRFKDQIKDLFWESFKLCVSAVGENDDTKLFYRKAGQSGAETDGFAAVVDLFHAAMFGEIPAEAVAPARSVRGRVWRKRGEQCGFADEFVSVKRGIPFGQIGD